ncbi:MAG: hypothetical protein JWR16_2966 [Nevskia sp.]|nr:hypothetical protein [Nevskia sp.]
MLPANLTVSMNIDYLDRSLPGEWLEADASISKMGRRLAFVSCQVHAKTRMVARASGVWLLQWRDQSVAGAAGGGTNTDSSTNGSSNSLRPI